MEGFWPGVVAALLIFSFIPGPSAHPNEIAWAQEVCATNGGIQAFRPKDRWILPAKVRCKNSAVFTQSALQEPPHDDQ